MTTAGPSPVPGQPASGPFLPDRRDWLRLLGGILFAAGALVLLFRKSSTWGHWAEFASVALPCLLLYGIALPARRAWPVLQGWQSAFFAFGVFLLPLALIEFISAVHGRPGSALNVTWVFAVSAVVALATSLLARAWWQAFIGGTYVVVAVVVLGTKIIDSKPNTVRWLFVAAAVVLFVAGLALGRLRRPQSSDLIAAGGLAAIVAGVFSVVGLSQQLSGAVGTLGASGVPRPTDGWNIYLLVVSLLLIAYGVRSFTRGPAYLGAIGLAAFIVLVGTNVVALVGGKDVHTAAGWPLILLIGGGVLLLLGLALRPGLFGGPGGTTEPPRQVPVPRQPGAPPPGQAGPPGEWRPPAPPGQGG